MTRLPLVEPLNDDLTPVEAFARLAGKRHCLFLDSALRHSDLGRFSYVAADPIAFVRTDSPDLGGLVQLETFLETCRASTVPGLPPFQGGAAGLLSYDLSSGFERLPCPRFDEFRVPPLAIGIYDVVLAFDHAADRGWLISHGFAPGTPGICDNTNPPHRAARRALQFRDWLASEPSRKEPQRASTSSHVQLQGPTADTSLFGRVASNFTQSDYLAAVQRAIDYIEAGDIFQVNLAQRLICPAWAPAELLYRHLRERNRATFAGYFDIGDFQILSASPERFLKVSERKVETRPIKGTRPRNLIPEVDMFSRRELRESEKDKSENIMIVDLMRNDLSRVCKPASVRVEQLCEIETYEFVQHLVSSVTGELEDRRSPIDLLRSSFPGGSITGAPKVRAMEIIAELEPHARGAYCGSLGFIGFDGAMDFNILIRTITAGKGWWQFPVGGGIVADSHPKSEYEETWHKAEGILRAISDCLQTLNG